jgi:hypothetical protein
VALGDSCLFQVSGDRLVRSVPLSEHAQFGRRPPLFYTMRPQTERVIGHLATPNGGWTAGDQFFLLTDAIAAWFLNEVEQGRKPWHLLAQLDQKSFETFVDEQRYLQLMEDDDVTAVLLQPLPVGVPVPVGPIPEPELELELEPELELGPELELEPEPEPQPEPVGVRGAGGGALPHWDERAERYLERLRKPSIVATLIVAIVIGFLIGKALGGGSTPTPTPTPVSTPTRTASPAPTVSEAQAMDTAADQFTNTLLNFHGGVGAYEQAMHSSVTPALAGRLPRLLGLRASGLTSLASTGTVVFTTPNLAAGTVYVGATQQLTKNGKPLASRFLVVRLTLAQVGTTWAVSDVTIQPAANRLFPPARSGKSASGSTGGSSN